MAKIGVKRIGKQIPQEKNYTKGLYFVPEIDESLLINNPFTVGEFAIRVNEIAIPGNYTIYKGKNGEEIKLPVYIEVEVDSFTKVYKSKEKNTIVWGLPVCSEMLWHWIERNIKNNEDYIIINVGRYMKDRRLKSIKTYNNAIKGLIRYSFLSPTEFKDKEVYWINPVFCFDGRRERKYKDKLIKK